MKKMSWKTSIIITLVILTFGGLGVYQYRNHCIIAAVEYGLSGEIDPTKDMHVEDYDSIQEYSEACQEVESYYEEQMFKVVAEKFWSTPEHVKKMYMDYYEKKYCK